MNRVSRRRHATACGLILLLSGFSEPASCDAHGGWFAELDENTQARVVKLYGSGGVAGLEGQQTGLLVSDQGHVLTVEGALLDSGEATVVTSLGDRYNGRVVATDHLTGVALLRVEARGMIEAWFDLEETPAARPAEPVWCFSNAFGIAGGNESVSVQRAIVAALAPLEAEGPFGSPPGLTRVIHLDAVVSNPGAAGGAVVDSFGRLLGMIGQETRGSATGGWVNYAIPVSTLQEAYERLVVGGDDAPGAAGGESATGIGPFAARRRLLEIGLVVVPAITDQTPAYVEQVAPGSVAHQAGLRSDDLVIAIAGRAAPSAATAPEAIVRSAQAQVEVVLSVLREGQIIEARLTLEDPR